MPSHPTLPDPHTLMRNLASAVTSTAAQVMQQAPQAASRLPILPDAISRLVELTGRLPSGAPAYTTQRDVAQLFRDLGATQGLFPAQVPQMAGLFGGLLGQAAGQPTEQRRANLAQEALQRQALAAEQARLQRSSADAIATILEIGKSDTRIARQLARELLDPEAQKAIAPALRRLEQQAVEMQELLPDLARFFLTGEEEAVKVAKAKAYLYKLGVPTDQYDLLIGIAKDLASGTKAQQQAKQQAKPWWQQPQGQQEKPWWWVMLYEPRFGFIRGLSLLLQQLQQRQPGAPSLRMPPIPPDLSPFGGP